MAGFVALGNNQYIGTLVNGTDNLENGVFVVPNWANGTAAVPADDASADGDVMFVCNEIDTVVEQAISDIDFKIASGEYLKLKVPQAGEIFVTTKFKGNLVKGDVVAVGDGGTLEAIGTRTPKYKFVVEEVTTFLGANAVKVVAL